MRANNRTLQHIKPTFIASAQQATDKKSFPAHPHHPAEIVFCQRTWPRYWELRLVGPTFLVDPTNPAAEEHFYDTLFNPKALRERVIPDHPPAAFLHFWILTCVRVHNYSGGCLGGQAGRQGNTVGLVAERCSAAGNNRVDGSGYLSHFVICWRDADGRA